MWFCRRLADKQLSKDPLEQDDDDSARTNNNEFSLAKPVKQAKPAQPAQQPAAAAAAAADWVGSMGNNVRQSADRAGNAFKSALGPVASDLKTRLSKAEAGLRGRGISVRKMYEWAGCLEKCASRMALATAAGVPGNSSNPPSSSPLSLPNLALPFIPSPQFLSFTPGDES